MKYKRQKEEGEKSCGIFTAMRRCGSKFCCSNGLYPLMVAPFISVAWLLDLYSTLGCDFIRINIGIEPINVAWNKTSTINLGLFHYDDSAEVRTSNTPFYMQTIHPECRRFEEIFSEYFIDGDKTWKMSQILSIVSGSGGAMATLIIWLFVILPLPVSFFWPAILLPSVLAMSIAGGSKFLIFDTEICNSALWVPAIENAEPMKVDSCDLSSDSYVGIISTTLSFLCLLFTCMKYPQKRNAADKNRSESNNYLDILRTDSSIHSNDHDVEENADAMVGNKKSKGRGYDMDLISDNNAIVPSEAGSKKLRIYNQKKNLKLEKLRSVDDSFNYGHRGQTPFESSTGFHSQWTPSPREEAEEEYENGAFSFHSPLTFHEQRQNSPESHPFDEDKIHKCLAKLEQSFSG